MTTESLKKKKILRDNSFQPKILGKSNHQSSVNGE